MWIELSLWAKHVEIFVSHVNAQRKVISEEENFHNQVDKMTHSVELNQFLFSTTTAEVLPKGQGNKNGL